MLINGWGRNADCVDFMKVVYFTWFIFSQDATGSVNSAEDKYKIPNCFS